MEKQNISREGDMLFFHMRDGHRPKPAFCMATKPMYSPQLSFLPSAALSGEQSKR